MAGRTSSFALEAGLQVTEADTFELLSEQYAGRVHRLAVRMLGDADEAADVTQEVLLSAWRALPALREPAAARTWLFRIAYRQCLVVLRGRRPIVPLDAIPEPRAADDPQRAAESGARLRALRAALSRLPRPLRQVWLLAEVDGMSYAEIAHLVGTTEPAVRGRLSRSRARLAELMRSWR